MNQPARGDVWWLEDPDLGRRPALVLTRDGVIPHLTWVLVAPLTRTLRGIPTEVALEPAEDGVPERCAVTLDNIRPVRKALLTSRIAHLDVERMAAVCQALRVAVAC